MKRVTERAISAILKRFEILRRHEYKVSGYIKMLTAGSKRKVVMANNEDLCFDKCILPVIKGFSNCGIVFQGPKCKEDNFTINTILLYRTIYPDIKIVFSTWKGELATDEKLLLKESNCIYIENESCPTEDKGKGRKPAHLNNQLKSSLTGVRYLKENGVEYILKIRSDLRIYKYDMIPYFYNLLALYPSQSDIQKKRFLVVSFTNNLIYCPFHMSDFIWFGSIEDIERLYSIPSRTDQELTYIRNYSDIDLADHSRKFLVLRERAYNRNNDFSWIEELNIDYKFYYLFHEEAYIIYTFLKNNGGLEKSINPIGAYWEFLKKSVIVVNEEDLGVYWTKYGYSLLKRSPLYTNSQLINSIWLDIFMNS